MTIEVEDYVSMGVNMVFPCNEIKKTAWEVLQNFDHALVLREDEPLLPAILGVYEAQGIKDGAPKDKQNIVVSSRAEPISTLLKNQAGE
jgi:6-pyruvoyltetrahydropterin/6-carboxytetrahydropterin synthase